MLTLKDRKEALSKTIKHFKELGIIIPTFAQLADPNKIDKKITQKLKKIDLNEAHPLNLFRINWKNNIKSGLFGDVNFIEIPRELTGVKARIIGLVGKHFPTGAHKVGAAFGCLIPKLVKGEFDPTMHKAVWPSTGNYCRGGAFDCALLNCHAVAILPQEMSKERFDWLKSIGAEVIATPGCESNVKEIYDKCWEIRDTRQDCIIFNQFDEFGNSIWHYNCTGRAVESVFKSIKTGNERIAGFVSATGSAGTIATGDYLKDTYPNVKIAAVEALQCPTLYSNGFGGHRIEGIGDKHVPWIHNARNTDFVIAVDDEDCMNILRLFNEPEGIKALKEAGIDSKIIKNLGLFGISGICNMLSSIKLAKYYELGTDDIIFTVFTDSADLYGSRIKELEQEKGKYSKTRALIDFEKRILGAGIDYVKELDYYSKKAIHNLKYFTWVEQQGKSIEELNRLWDPDFWTNTYSQVKNWDKEIQEVNDKANVKI
ncbi:pyridoxal-phosphate dependent enzyme [Elusimicrobiota bacterium]